MKKSGVSAGKIEGVSVVVQKREQLWTCVKRWHGRWKSEMSDDFTSVCSREKESLYRRFNNDKKKRRRWKMENKQKRVEGGRKGGENNTRSIVIYKKNTHKLYKRKRREKYKNLISQ